MQYIMSSVYRKLGDMNTKIYGFEKNRFRNLVIAEACRQQNKHCVEQAQTFFKIWMKTNNPDSNNP